MIYGQNLGSKIGASAQVITPCDKGLSTLSKNFPAAFVIGVIFCLGALFLTLAAYQILPHGINALSNLGLWGHVVGYGTLGLGLVFVLVGGIKWHLSKKANVSQSILDRFSIEGLRREIPVIIPEEVKNSLDPLFQGGVENIPNFSKVFDRAPTVKDMKASIMKGNFINNENQKHYPFIAIKMRSVASKKEEVLILYHCKDRKFMWRQRQRHDSQKSYPQFFATNLTFDFDGRITNPEKFKLLQDFIQTGSGKDANGEEWELV